MSKSKARFLAELLSSDGKVIKAKSQASTIVVGDLPTVPNSKLANSSVTIAGSALSLGASLTLDTGDITEHTAYKYYTDARADARIVNAGSANWNTAYTYSQVGHLPLAGGEMNGALTIDVNNVAAGALRIEADQTNPNQDFYFAEEIYSTLSGSQTTTADREQGAIFIDLNSSATGGDTANEHRVYGIYTDVDSTGDADVVTGGYFNATATPTTGTTTGVTGVEGYAKDNGGAGATTSITGGKFQSWSDNSTSDVNAMYGVFGKASNNADSGYISAATGVYGEIEVATGSADIYGTSRVFQAQYDNNSGIAQTNSTYLYFGNYAGVLPTSAYGLYINNAVQSYFGGGNVKGVADLEATSLTISGAGAFSGTLSATGYNDSNWNTAYTYSQVGHVKLNGTSIISGSSASNGTRTAMVWMRGKVGDSVNQINVQGPNIEFGQGGTLDASPAFTFGYTGILTATGQINASGGNSAQWNTAYGWGNHASAGYSTTDTTYSVQDGELSQNNFTNADHSKLDGIAASANNYVLPSGYATETYVGTQISNLVDSSPAALNTLNELAAALGDDANFSTTITTSIGTKLPLAGGALTGAVTTNSTFDGRDVSVDGTKLDGIATGATNTAAPHYTSAIAVGAGGLTQQNFTTTLKNKLDGIAASANNYTLPFTNNSSNWNTAYGWGNHASAGYTNDQTAAEILTAIKTVDGSGSGLDADLLDGQQGSYYAAASHVHSYLPINNPTATGTLVSPIIRARKSQTQGNYTTAALWTESFSSTNTGIAFHISGNVGKMLDMRTDGHLYWENGRVWSATSDGSGSGLDADTVDGIQGASLLRSDASDTVGNGVTYTWASTNTEGLRFTNSSYAKSLYIGGWSGANTAGVSRIRNSNDNLHIDSGANGQLYLNNYNAQDVYVNGANKVWHAGNDGSGSGLDADLLDGQHGSYYYAASNPSGYTTNTGTLTSTNDRFYITDTRGANRAPSYYDDRYVQADFTQNAYLGVTGGDSWGTALTVSKWASWDASHRQEQLIFAGTKLCRRVATSDSAWSSTYTIWDSSTDGSGSGLDADLLDGNHASAFMLAGAAPNTHTHSQYVRNDTTQSLTNTINLRASGSHLGNHEFAPSSTGTSYSTAAIELRESNYTATSAATPPRLGFHWGGVVASNISMDSGGAITIRNNPGNAYENFRANNIYANGTNTVWHVGNDGAGSGLDADLLDGQQGSYYYPASNPNGYNNYVRPAHSTSHGVTAGNNYGIGFWNNSSSYTIMMGNNNTNHGTVTDYSIHHNMGTTAGRGFTFGSSRTAVTCSINALTGAILSSNNITAYSDIRVKANIEVIPNALDKVKQLSGYTFTRTDVEDKEQKYTGVIAQEVLKVLPEAVQLGATEEDTMSVAYGNMVGLMIEAIKELKSEVDDLKTELSQKGK